jgi:hypothetical protein
LAVTSGIKGFQGSFDGAQFGSLVLVHGEFFVALGDGLCPVFKVTDIVLGRHVNARNKAASLLRDARQKLATFLHEAFTVEGAGGVHASIVSLVGWAYVDVRQQEAA